MKYTLFFFVFSVNLFYNIHVNAKKYASEVSVQLYNSGCQFDRDVNVQIFNKNYNRSYDLHDSSFIGLKSIPYGIYDICIRSSGYYDFIIKNYIVDSNTQTVVANMIELTTCGDKSQVWTYLYSLKRPNKKKLYSSCVFIPQGKYKLLQSKTLKGELLYCYVKNGWWLYRRNNGKKWKKVFYKNDNIRCIYEYDSATGAIEAIRNYNCDPIGNWSFYKQGNIVLECKFETTKLPFVLTIDYKYLNWYNGNIMFFKDLLWGGGDSVPKG